MTAEEGLEKGLGALNSVIGAFGKFKKAFKDENNPDGMMVMSGVLDIANALAAFVPPPASLITGTISGIFGLFMEQGPSTDDLIEQGFKDMKEAIEAQTEEIINAMSKSLKCVYPA